jgi:hypothetical protein
MTPASVILASAAPKFSLEPHSPTRSVIHLISFGFNSAASRRRVGDCLLRRPRGTAYFRVEASFCSPGGSLTLTNSKFYLNRLV